MGPQTASVECAACSGHAEAFLDGYRLIRFAVGSITPLVHPSAIEDSSDFSCEYRRTGRIENGEDYADQGTDGDGFEVDA